MEIMHNKSLETNQKLLAGFYCSFQTLDRRQP